MICGVTDAEKGHDTFELAVELSDESVGSAESWRGSSKKHEHFKFRSSALTDWEQPGGTTIGGMNFETKGREGQCLR
jgi:hypothetical protein